MGFVSNSMVRAKPNYGAKSLLVEKIQKKAPKKTWVPFLSPGILLEI